LTGLLLAACNDVVSPPAAVTDVSTVPGMTAEPTQVLEKEPTRAPNEVEKFADRLTVEMAEEALAAWKSDFVVDEQLSGRMIKDPNFGTEEVTLLIL